VKEIKLEVCGRVQGVNFRNNVKRFCDDLGLKGYVTNREDGSVLIVAQGSKEGLRRFVEFIKKSPGLSNVDDVKERMKDVEEEFSWFEIVREGSILKDQKKALSNLGKNLFS